MVVKYTTTLVTMIHLSKMQKLIFYYMVAQIAFNISCIYTVPVNAYFGYLSTLDMVLIPFNYYVMFKHNYVFHNLLDRWTKK
jgi:hypothetical protein